jgi:hypothetical protein
MVIIISGCMDIVQCAYMFYMCMYIGHVLYEVGLNGPVYDALNEK